MTGITFQRRHFSRFLLLVHYLFLLAYNSSLSSSSSWRCCSSTIFVAAFTAPTAVIRQQNDRHTASMLSFLKTQPLIPLQQHVVLRTCPTTTTALNVVTSRRSSTVNNGSSAIATAATNSAFAVADRNGKNIMPTHEQQQDGANNKKRIPFIIEQLPNKKKSDFSPLDDLIFQEISEMCIDVFFNDDYIAQSKQAPIWKQIQLAYLRKLQQGDLLRRRKHYPDTNLMYIAREVIPVVVNNNAQSVHNGKPLVLDLSLVYNLPRRNMSTTTTPNLFNYINSNIDNNGHNGDDVDYVCGRILGFVEVTQRPYGLGEENEAITTTMTLDQDDIENNNNGVPSSSSYYHQQQQQVTTTPRRPILTNLSVRYEARGSGVGSCLLQTLEQGVLTQWKATATTSGMMMNNKEIILEVEDDNEKAIQFYQKRDYQPIYQDPASRRYDTNGLILRQMRCNRIIMRKKLVNNNNKSPSSSSSLVSASSSNGDELAFLVKAFQRLKESVLSF